MTGGFPVQIIRRLAKQAALLIYQSRVLSKKVSLAMAAQIDTTRLVPAVRNLARLNHCALRRTMKKPGHVKLLGSLNYAGAILTFLAALGVIASTTRYPSLLPLVFVVFVAGQFLIVIATVGLTKIRFNLKNVTALTGLYTLLSFWDLISVIIGLPFVAISMVLGPFMTIVFVLASVVLGLYFVEAVIGYDIRGYTSVLENPLQGFVALVALVISLLVLRWHFGKDEGEDWVLDKAGDLSFNIRQQLQGMVGEIIQKYSKIDD